MPDTTASGEIPAGTGLAWEAAPGTNLEVDVNRAATKPSAMSAAAAASWRRPRIGPMKAWKLPLKLDHPFAGSAL